MHARKQPSTPTAGALTVLCLVAYLGAQGFDSDVFAPFTFLHYGDPQIGFALEGIAADISRFGLAKDRANAIQPAFVIIAGDLVNQQTSQEWAAFDSILNLFSVPVKLVVGNHDVWSGSSLNYFRNNYGDDYYVFTYSNCDFVVINSVTILDSSTYASEYTAQWAWLGTTLQQSAAADRERIFIAMHHPPFQVTEYDPDDYYSWPAALRGRLSALLREHGVTVVPAGHVHKTLMAPASDGAFTVYTASGTSRIIGGGGQTNSYAYRTFSVTAGDYSQRYVLLSEIPTAVSHPTGRHTGALTGRAYTPLLGLAPTCRSIHCRVLSTRRAPTTAVYSLLGRGITEHTCTVAAGASVTP
jgi:3',5'-cyclic AMP phosphodiesterase CpdA